MRRCLIAALAALLAFGGLARAQDRGHRGGGFERGGFERGGGRPQGFGAPAYGPVGRGAVGRGGGGGFAPYRDGGGRQGGFGGGPYGPGPRYVGGYPAGPGLGGVGGVRGRGFNRGQFLPPGAGGFLADPGAYRLRRPPNGYGWVTVGPNAYLTQRSTGLILDTAPLY